MSSGFNRLLDAVVRIDVSETSFEDGSMHPVRGTGSGVIISPDGLILTNAHVVSPHAAEVLVTLASLEQVDAKLVGWDHWTDLAVIRLNLGEIKRRHLGFTAAEFGESGKLYPGETVFAVGTPYGLARTVTRGIISNNNRPFSDPEGVDGYETGDFNTWLQTDAAINPGNSGGPLVTEDGRIVGINSRAYIGAENLGFAVPSSVARSVSARLVHDGEIVRSYVGIVPMAMRDMENFYSLAANTGLLVSGVDVGSPAARAGLRPLDVILALNGHKLDGRFPEQLPAIADRIASLPVGARMHLDIRRGGQPLTLDLVTERLESHVGEEYAFEKWGLSVRKVTRVAARQAQLADDTGVEVIGVRPGFPAAQAGVEPGDIITKVSGEPILELGRLKEVYRDYTAKPGPVLIEAQRNRRVALYVFKP
ncbi:MAG TPA: trypsin-like peptidase domain-containing protein [Candidatus Didemnitutus sp.]